LVQADVALRPVGAQDEAFLRFVYGSTRESELQLLDWDEAQKEAFVHQQFRAQTRWYEEQYPEADRSVVLVDGTEAGRLYVARWPAEIRIVDIALLPPFRNRGVGTRLLRALVEEGASSGRPLTIHVERFNPAMRLYERLGFRPVEDRGVYVLMRSAAGR
jgi:GNAT superfamily N-acetyltransferase